MRVLLIGLGRWGEKHLRVLTELGVELWVADLSEERRAFAVKAGVAPARVETPILRYELWMWWSAVFAEMPWIYFESPAGPITVSYRYGAADAARMTRCGRMAAHRQSR